MTAARELAGILREAVRTSLQDSSGSGRKEISIMFSGGVDSAILAVIARKFCDVKLHIAGMEGSNDLEWGTECGRLLDLPVNQIIFTYDDVLQAMENVVLRHEMDNSRWMSTFTAFDIVLSRIGEPAVICGQGADELFGGYRKYQDMAPDDAESRMISDYRELAFNEMPVYSAMARYYGAELIAPYLEQNVVDFAGHVALEQKLGQENKQILRQAAEMLGVPGSMAHRPKKAMQYGSGVSRAIKSHVRASGIDLPGIIQNIKNRQMKS